MKIGILTLPLHTNYGGILQAYALQTVLKKMGHEVVVFDNSNRRKVPGLKIYLKRLYRKYIKGRNFVFFEELKYNREYPVISQNIQPFINRYINRKELKSFEDINESEYDAIIVGSDQVWRHFYFPSMWQCNIDDAFLGFAKDWNIKRIAYAASFGTDEWEYTNSETEICRNLLSSFDGTSVREDSAVKLCAKHFAHNPVHVLDPTMLLDKEDYIETFMIAKTEKSKGTLLNYILDWNEQKHELIAKISKDRSLVPFEVNSNTDDSKAPLSDRVQPSVESWLRGFYDAKFVVTDSFHACVFAILFGKPFVAIGNVTRGMSRFNSLLGMFGLLGHLITDMSQYNSSGTYQIPNEVYGILRELRRKSSCFLADSLNR